MTNPRRRRRLKAQAKAHARRPIRDSHRVAQSLIQEHADAHEQLKQTAKLPVVR